MSPRLSTRVPRPGCLAHAHGWAVLLVLGGLALVPQPAAATVLLFDQQRDATTQSIVGPTASGGVLPADYGDNVTGPAMAVPGGVFTYGDGGEGFTPDVTVDIFSPAATPGNPGARLWQTGYGDLVNVVFGEGPGVGGAPLLSIRLSASAGHEVDLYGFDVAGWNNADYTIAGVDVLAGATSLFSATDVLVEGDFDGPRHTGFAFAQPLSAQEIVVRLDLSNLAASLQDNVGLDSIRFGQTPPGVPEPAAGWLLLWGLLMAAGRSRSR